jgi:hypothetical protein
VFLTAASALAQQQPLHVIYTGKLLGYARMPDYTELGPSGRYLDCHPAPTPTEPWDCQVSRESAPATAGARRHIVYSPAASQAAAMSELGDHVRRELARPPADPEPPGASRIILGMGDNFAMDYFARVVVLNENGKLKRYVPKDELSYSRKAQGWLLLRDFGSSLELGRDLAPDADRQTGLENIDGDNVVSFFTSQKYAALVPGEHDFYYGPERLRELAGLLAAGGTQMLGANLVIRTSYAKPPATIPPALRKHGYDIAQDRLRWALPATPLPWIQKFRLRAARGAIQENRAELCEIPPGDPALSKPGQGCRTMDAVWEGNDAVFANPLAHLDSERSYLLCAQPIQSARPLCRRLDVSSPFLQYPDWAHPALSGNQPLAAAIPKRDTPEPYFHDPARNLVVMGVVARGLESMVGTLNLQWENKDPQFNTSVVTADPAEALDQLLDYCERQGHCNGRTTLILMAQMPPSTAHVLNQQLRTARSPKGRFHLVLAQADPHFATAPETAAYAPGHPPVVLVPDEVFAGGSFGVELQHALLRDGALTTWSSPRRLLPVKGSMDEDSCLTKRLATAWTSVAKHSVEQQEEQLRDLTLHAMRKHQKADIALLQRRDLFLRAGWTRYCQVMPAPGFKELATLEQILWKGDFVLSRTLTGAAIKAAMAESERLFRLENDRYSLEVESGRYLEVLGLKRVSDGAAEVWYVNGTPLEDRTLYSVAMTDFLAFGDTGYPTLKKGPVGSEQRIIDLKDPPRVTELLAKELHLVDPSPAAYGSYTDYIQHLAFHPGPRETIASKLRQQIPAARAFQPSKEDPRDKLSQSRIYWRLFADKGEIGFNRYAHNLDANPGRLFGDTPESGVSAPRRNAFTSGLQLELRREWPSYHFFARLEQEFTSERTEQRDGNVLRNYPANLLSGEAGVRLAFVSTMRRRPWYGAIFSGKVDTQFQDPFVTYTLRCNEINPVDGQLRACGDISYQAEVGRRTRTFLKAGLHAEARASWIEIGLFGGTAARAFQYTPTFQGKTLAGSPCAIDDLGASTTVGGCVTQRFPITPGQLASFRANRGELAIETGRNRIADSGVFLNFNWRHRLPAAWKFREWTVESRTSRFFNHSGNALLDPRWVSRIEMGPVLAIFSSLSLKPAYSIFLYENKVRREFLRGGRVDIRLEYRFDLKSGSRTRTVFGYGRPR